MKFDADKLHAELAALPPLHRVAFAASCCERLLPNYRAFSKAEGWGDYKTLRSALDEVWKVVKGEQVFVEMLRSLAAECDAALPDTEDFASPLTSAALDAGAAVVETLKCCIDGDPARAVTVAGLSRDTVDMYIQERDEMDYADPDFEEVIAKDPLMVRELKKQAEDLRILKKTSALDDDIFQKLITDRKSNIDVAVP